jgi:hypothetical protein
MAWSVAECTIVYPTRIELGLSPAGAASSSIAWKSLGWSSESAIAKNRPVARAGSL